MNHRFICIFFISLLLISMLILTTSAPVSAAVSSQQTASVMNKKVNTLHSTVLTKSQSQNTILTPSWWNGVCDDVNYYNGTSPQTHSKTLGSSYRGLITCGPMPHKGAPENTVYFPLGSQVQVNEWQCTELAMRYLYLAYGVWPYKADGGGVVWNYSGPIFQQISNQTGSGNAPQAGDIISYGSKTGGGHVSIVTKSHVDSSTGDGTVWVIDENGFGEGAGPHTVTDWFVDGTNDGKTNVISGWLHAYAALNPLSLESGPPTATITVSGKGMQASETVAINFNSIQLVTTQADSTGAFSATITVPSSTQPGMYGIQATGLISKRSTDQAAFTVVSTDWTAFGYDPQHTHYAPYENIINTSNVSGLTLDWTSAPTGSVIVSSPAVVNGVVYVGSEDDHLYAYNANTGVLLWSTATGSVIESSPAVEGGIVYVGSFDGTLYAFNAATGSTLWTVSTGTYIAASPVIMNNIVYITSFNGFLYAVNAQTGIKLWSTSMGRNTDVSPAVSNNMVFVDPNRMQAYNATTGAELWGNSQIGLADTSVAVQGTVVYVGSGLSQNPVLYAFNAKTGTLLWTALGGGAFSRSAPAVANGIVYIGSDDGKLYAFNAKGCHSSPCSPLWSATTSAPIESSPTIANGVVYIGSDDNHLYAFDATTGILLWSFTFAPGEEIISSPAVVNGTVYVGSAASEGKVYAFHLPGTQS